MESRFLRVGLVRLPFTFPFLLSLLVGVAVVCLHRISPDLRWICLEVGLAAVQVF